MASKHRDGQIMPHHSVAFRLKCERELDKLRAQLSVQLKNDMLRLLNDNSFADFKFVVQGHELFAHSSILKTRVPTFFNYCLSNQDDCNNPAVVALPGLKKDQLQNFFRAVYSSEEVVLEEALVLKAILQFAPLSLIDGMNSAPAIACNGLRPSVSESFPASTDTSSPRDDSLETGARYQQQQQQQLEHFEHQQLEDEENHDDHELLHHHEPFADNNLLQAVAVDEQYSSSECLHHPHHHTGTLADVTDPFSLSTPLDTFNVSTLNLASDRASVASIEDDDLNAFDMSDAPPLATSEEVVTANKAAFCPDFDDGGQPEEMLFKPGARPLFAPARPSLVASFLARTKCGVEQDMSVDSVDGSVPCCVGGQRARTQLQERQLITTNELRGIEDVASTFLVPQLDTTSVVVPEEAGVVRSGAIMGGTESIVIMACSHESKEGDSGICSFNQRLSASSVSPPGYVASPAGSLPKDDSLEFCPDSLASSINAATAAIVFGLVSSPMGEAAAATNVTSDWLNLEEEELSVSGGGTAVTSHKSRNVSLNEPLSRSLNSECEPSGDVGEQATKMNGSEHRSAWTEDADATRRWSLSSNGVSSAKSHVMKPSAIVMPYNIDDDDFVRRRPPTSHPVDPADNTGDQEISPTTAAMEAAARHQAVQLDFVPFLKEMPHAATNFHSEGVYPNHHLAAFNGHRGATNWLDPALEPYEDILVDNAAHPPTCDQAATMESLPIITGYAPALSSSSSGPHQSVQSDTELRVAENVAPNAIDSSDRVRPFFTGFVNGSDNTTDETQLDCGTSDPVEDVGRRQKQEAFFMFIDVGKANGVAAKSMEDLGSAGGGAASNSANLLTMDETTAQIDGRRDPPPSAEIVVGSREVNGTPPPPPVYMYIEATEAQHGHHVRMQGRASDKHEVVARRRGRGGANGGRSRPKSESAATMGPGHGEGGDGGTNGNGRTDKRMSLGFEDDDDVTYSIDNSLEGDLTHSARGEEKKRTASTSSRRYCSKLGDQLLRMFLEEINPDVTIWVGDREIKAHKSILTARCVYFAAMLSGTWIENAGNVIKMQGFSYAAVHFAVRHIYGGAAAVPDELDLSELASLADMLGLEGMKEVVALALKIKYCHFFHKPCALCVAGISECLLIAASFGLDDLQESCLRWITRHQLKIWPTKAFAALPDDILHKCYLSAVADMVPDNVLDTLLGCDKLMATLPHVKWSEPVFALTTRLSEACAEYLAAHFAEVLRHDTFLGLRSGQSWNIHALEATFLLAVERLPLEVACQAYVHLSATQQSSPAAIITAQEMGDVGDNPGINENYEALVNKIHRQVEHFLIHNANRIVRCNSWSLLNETLQKKIRDAAVIVFEFGKPTAPPPRLSSLNRKFVGSRAAASPSASVERAARVAASRASASKSLTSSVVVKKAGSTQQNHQQANDKSKAATLPRVGAMATKKMEAAGESQLRVNSPMTATATNSCSGVVPRVAPRRSATAPRATCSGRDDTVPQADSDFAGREHRSSGARKMDSSHSSVNGASGGGGESTVVATNKAIAVKDKAAHVVKSKEKNLVKELSKEGRPAAAVNGVPLRSAVRVSNGILKTSSPVPRPKSAGYTISASRLTKQPPTATTTNNGGSNLRDPKTGGMRKTISSDLHSKDKDENRMKARPRSDDISTSSTSKKPAQRLNIARTLRPSTSKV